MSECADQQKASYNNQIVDVSAFCHTVSVATFIYEKELQNMLHNIKKMNKIS